MPPHSRVEVAPVTAEVKISPCDPDFIRGQNTPRLDELQVAYVALMTRLARENIDIAKVTDQVAAFCVAIPSWGVGTGGTRFARFPGPGEPRNVQEKLDDCAVIQALTRATPSVSLHLPWDRAEDYAALKTHAQSRGLAFSAMNSNTFQDQSGQAHSYKFGSLTHTSAEVRAQAIDHNREVIKIGQALGSKALTLWIGDGANFPGQQHLRLAFERYLESASQIYRSLPPDWQLLIEHKMYEPAFYATVIQDWGSSLMAARTLGPQAFCLVDLGHHAPNVNIEMIVARLLFAQRLGGFHFNDSKYGDDDLDAGSIDPFRLFLIFNELVDAERGGGVPQLAHMLDQSHNVTDPIESLITSAVELQRAYARALLVNRTALDEYQRDNDVIMARETLKRAFNTDVSPILAMAREARGGAIDPIEAYRASGYRAMVARCRPPGARSGSGIV